MTDKTKDTRDMSPSDLSREVNALRAEVAKLNNHRYIRLHDSPMKLGLFQLYRGLAFGFGSVVGASILVSLAAFFLSQIDFIPIIGDWALELAKEIDADNAESYGVNEEAGDSPASADNPDDEEAAADNPSPGATDQNGDPGASDFGINAPDTTE
ncbi:DUF5665 domain-containing protein [Maritimibacter sp. DP1N21-5]|uniref:DUF5665 domain-containing protein n=1 Tax=Maritimibacter sp. DP1N21-5 TaxID=2836867 RepID=UPI001C43EF1D|nr:DUF5665 domain-containing protein [Maritimibacter sp. DP1N21-5]MBV7407910.1 hypothetical protein [Maritimibacter sp. DP1N21-5]